MQAGNVVRSTILRYLRAHLPNEAHINRGDSVLQLGTARRRTLESLLWACGASGKVLVVEAARANYDNLTLVVHGLASGDQARVQLFHGAAFEERTTLNLGLSDDFIGDHRLELDGIEVDNDDRTSFLQSETVEAYPIDTIVEMHDFAPDVILCTINGAELSALRGAASTLDSMPAGSRLFVKSHALKDGTPIFGEAAALLRAHGFVVHRTKESSSVSNAARWGRRQGDIFAYRPLGSSTATQR